MNKTVVVEVKTVKRHRMYGKLLKWLSKFKARDEIGVQLGDSVLIEECAPYSKTVTWKVVEKLAEEVK